MVTGCPPPPTLTAALHRDILDCHFARPLLAHPSSLVPSHTRNLLRS